jgi:hypothetical protein
MFEAGNGAVVFLAGLPDAKARIIAVHNLFGPNLLVSDMAEFLTVIGYGPLPLAYIQSVLDGSDDAPAAPAPESVTGPVTATEQARECLAAAKEAPTEVVWASGGDIPLYERPLAALRDAQVASGQAVLAVAAEMPATRAEVAEVAAAVRGLTQTLNTVLGPLCSRVADIERALDAAASETVGELSELCTEVSETRAVIEGVAVGAAESAVAELGDIAGALRVLADRADRPHWWQWRRRLVLRRIAAEAATEVEAETDRDTTDQLPAPSVGGAA